MTSHYDQNTPGQYSQPTPPAPRKKKIPLIGKIAIFIGGGFALLVGGCTALVGGSLAAETVANNGADPAPVISTQIPAVRTTPRAPKPVEQAPTDKPTVVDDPTTPPPPTKTKPAMTASQEQALGMAQSYLEYQAFSRKGLIIQLSSSAGEGFSKADATYAVDHVKVDWNEQAAKAAKGYLDFMHFSRAGLIHQLESDAGEGFTHAQAVYGVKAAGL